MEDKQRISRQKRYGQYFSGKKVSDLLVSLLPRYAQINNAIDPMVGTGDMLSALRSREIRVERLVGIEIDPLIIDICRRNNPTSEIIQGNAFSTRVPNAPKGWDLVITNPPYVRYQLLNGTDNTDETLSGKQIRSDLISTIKKNEHLNKRDKELFIELAQSYSGLSDMAVPAWLLCASMVKLNGYLAMVVPDTWLNREYATPIHNLLLRCYDVLSIVSDSGLAWFDNAQVKTCLVIAQRKATVEFSETLNAETYCVRLGKNLIGDTSLVDSLFYKNSCGIVAFSDMVNDRVPIVNDDFRASVENTYTLFPRLFNRNLIKESDTISSFNFLPVGIREALSTCTLDDLITLEEMGWGVGQGLRTGANDFFYCDIVSQDIYESIVRFNWYEHDVSVENQNLMPVLQNRNEIHGLCVLKELLSRRVLYITKQTRGYEMDALSSLISEHFSLLNNETSDYITAGETYVPTSGKSLKTFPERSAVKTNESKDNTGYKRFWYMLPKLVPRHIPSLCIPRVTGKIVECLFVEQSQGSPIAVDANFITLWNNDSTMQHFAFALLNSTWFKCYIENISTVMGGGALKVEAVHVRKVLFPNYSAEQIELLAQCGKALRKELILTPALQNEIDTMVLKPFDRNSSEVLGKMKATLRILLSERGQNFD
jgi:hypothetical protein